MSNVHLYVIKGYFKTRNIKKGDYCDRICLFLAKINKMLQVEFSIFDKSDLRLIRTTHIGFQPLTG